MPSVSRRTTLPSTGDCWQPWPTWTSTRIATSSFGRTQRLLTKQMTGQFRVRHPRLQLLHEQATALVQRLGRVRFEHIPRADNAAADRLANAAIDGAEDQTPGKPPSGSVLPPVATAQSFDTTGTVLGIGVDIESIARVDRLYQQYGDRLLNRAFTDEEQAYCLPPSVSRPTPGRPVCGQRSGNKGVGDGTVAGGAVAGRRGCARVRPTATSVSRWRVQAIRRRWRPQVVRHHHAFGRLRTGSSAASGTLIGAPRFHR